MRLPDAEDLAHFIARNYNGAKRIVEIGVGAYPFVAERVKELLPGARVTVTDVDGEKVDQVREGCPTLEAVRDDVFEPSLKAYEGADLVYSIRPPSEMIPEILKLASRVGCDLLIRPYSDEEGGYGYPKEYGWHLTSYKRANFYWLKKGHGFTSRTT